MAHLHSLPPIRAVKHRNPIQTIEIEINDRDFAPFTWFAAACFYALEVGALMGFMQMA